MFPKKSQGFSILNQSPPLTASNVVRDTSFVCEVRRCGPVRTTLQLSRCANVLEDSDFFLIIFAG